MFQILSQACTRALSSTKIPVYLSPLTSEYRLLRMNLKYSFQMFPFRCFKQPLSQDSFRYSESTIYM